MSGKRIGYCRVSTVDQNPERQLANIELDKKFIDYASGKDAHRPKLRELLDYVREDDIVYVESIDRLARNTMDLLTLVKTFKDKGVTLKFVFGNLEFNQQDDPIANLTLQILALIAEFQRKLILESQKIGIQKAKEEGKYKKAHKISKEDMLEIKNEYENSRRSVNELAQKFGVHKRSIYNYLNFLKKEENAD